MFEKVVWATDGSDSADRALDVAKGLVLESGGALLAVHSVEALAGPGARGAFPEDPADDELQAKIARQIEDLTGAGVNARLRVVHGGVRSAAHALSDVAREEGADLVVIGTRGLTPLAGLLLGSVTQRLLHIAPCPVLVVPSRSA